ncbi:hypothetical protein AGMMS4956_06850 [Bacteroidia bacterium]|nr:hypothetical protein AGMMS4956_06850 [Bacteroidia bacterium]
MPYRYQLNPALMNDHGYFALGIGNINVALQSNLALSTFLYPGSEGKVITFLDPSVSSKKFLGKLNKTNETRVAIDWDILSFGFFAWGGYNTFGVSAHGVLRADIPKDLFAFMKNGMDNPNGTSYDMGGMKAKGYLYTSIAFGHARPINDELTIGATLKVLQGAANVDAGISDFSLSMSPDKWSIKMSADAALSLATGGKFITDGDGLIPLDGIPVEDYENFGVGSIMRKMGFGLAADLGATYQLLENLQLSAALTDLGFIRWKKPLYASTNNTVIEFDGIKNADPLDSEWKVEDAFDEIIDQIEGMTDVRPGDAPKSKTTTYLNSNLRLGGEYALLNKRLSLGLLSTTRFAGGATSTELMGAVNLKFLRSFNFVLNASTSTFGNYWGFLLNYAPRYILNIYIGADYLPFQFVKVRGIGVPVVPNTLSAQVNFGITIPLGRNKLKEKKSLSLFEDLSDMEIIQRDEHERLETQAEKQSTQNQQVLDNMKKEAGIVDADVLRKEEEKRAEE